MSFSRQECCVLNSGDGAWAFESLASQLASLLGIEISTSPRKFNYVLYFEEFERLLDRDVFIPIKGVQLASDKRLLADVFRVNNVPTPVTKLFQTFEEAIGYVHGYPALEWCIKYPTSCGANGHRMLTDASAEPPNWPRPFVVQEFIRLERPEVYRTYCAAGELLGWVVRRFSENTTPSPWVAHARGARYATLGNAPSRAMDVAQRALKATNLWESFG